MKYEVITPQPLSDWVCYLSGDPSNPMGSVTYRPPKDREPKWFNRKMQELFFGIKWYKHGKL